MDRLQLDKPAGARETVEPVPCAAPDRAVTPLQQSGKGAGPMVAARWPENPEHRMDNGVRPAGGRSGNSACNPPRIELSQAVMRGDPVLAFPRLQDRRYVRVGQALVDAEGRESVPVEQRQSFRRTEPQETARVAHDAVDGVVRQSICDGVRLQRQARGADGCGTEEPKRRTEGNKQQEAC